MCEHHEKPVAPDKIGVYNRMALEETDASHKLAKIEPIWHQHVKISPHVSQKRLRFGDDVGKRKFIKFAKKYHQQLEEEEYASVGRITVCAMSPPQLADIGVLLQEAEEATRD